MSPLDCRGQRCPLPVIALARLAAASSPGAELELWADDPAADTDVPAWCRMRGHAFLASRPLPDGGTAYDVRLA